MKVCKEKLLEAIMIVYEWMSGETMLGNFDFGELTITNKEYDEKFILEIDDKVFGLFMDKVGFDIFEQMMKKFQ